MPVVGRGHRRVEKLLQAGAHPRDIECVAIPSPRGSVCLDSLSIHLPGRLAQNVRPYVEPSWVPYLPVSCLPVRDGNGAECAFGRVLYGRADTPRTSNRFYQWPSTRQYDYHSESPTGQVLLCNNVAVGRDEYVIMTSAFSLGEKIAVAQPVPPPCGLLCQSHARKDNCGEAAVCNDRKGIRTVQPFPFSRGTTVRIPSLDGPVLLLASIPPWGTTPRSPPGRHRIRGLRIGAPPELWCQRTPTLR